MTGDRIFLNRRTGEAFAVSAGEPSKGTLVRITPMGATSDRFEPVSVLDLGTWANEGQGQERHRRMALALAVAAAFKK